jgi:hypothetical protein
MSRRTYVKHAFFALVFAGITLFYKLPMVFYAVEIGAGLLAIATVLRPRSVSVNRIMLVTVLFLLYLSVNFASMLRYEHTVGDFATVAAQFTLVTALVVFVSQFRRIRPNVLLRLWVVAGLVAAVVTFREYAGFVFLGQEATFYIGPLPRATGPFGEPSNLGHFLVPPAVILMVSSVRREHLFATRYRQLGALVVIVVAAMLSLSQGAIATLGITMAAFVLTYVSSVEQLVQIVSTITAVVTGLALLPGFPIVRSYILRFLQVVAFFTGGTGPASQLAYSSVGTRLANGLVNIYIWSDSVLFGVGANQIRHHFQNYEVGFPGRVQGIYGVPWTGYLADFGLIGFAIISSIFLFSFRTILHHWRENSTLLWAPVMFFVLFSRVISQFLTGSIVDPVLWTILAVVVACAYGQGTGNRRDPSSDRETGSISSSRKTYEAS